MTIPPETNSAFLNSLTVLSRRIRTLFNARVTKSGLTYPRARALLRLSQHEPVSQKFLACELELEQPTLARLLDRMEDLDLIERTPNPSDGRAKLVHLTPHGREQAQTVVRISQKLKEEIFAGLSLNQIENTIEVLSVISDNAIHCVKQEEQTHG